MAIFALNKAWPFVIFIAPFSIYIAIYLAIKDEKQ